jgi:hypothetical protein
VVEPQQIQLAESMAGANLLRQQPYNVHFEADRLQPEFTVD